VDRNILLLVVVVAVAMYNRVKHVDKICAIKPSRNFLLPTFFIRWSQSSVMFVFQTLSDLVHLCISIFALIAAPFSAYELQNTLFKYTNVSCLADALLFYFVRSRVLRVNISMIMAV
jgi:hypothetical protein